MDRFEYKIIRRRKDQIDELNKLGSERWQIVGVRSNKIYLMRIKRGD